MLKKTKVEDLKKDRLKFHGSCLLLKVTVRECKEAGAEKRQFQKALSPF